MAKYRKILVAFDGSESAKNALIQACRLAKLNKSWIKVLAVLPAYEGDLELVGVSNIKETIKGSGDKLVEKAKSIADKEDVHILTNIEQGEPYDRIVHVADEENCDLIVMGRRGLTHLERELMGSVTARVIGHTGKDVLVIPEDSELSWENILLSTDGSKYNDVAVARAIDLAGEHSSKLTVVSAVFTNEEFSALAPAMVNELVGQAKSYVDAVVKKTEGKGLSVATVVKEGEPHQVITEVAAETGAHLIVMGSHGRKGLTRLLMGSVTERVIGFANCPILVNHIKS